MSNTQKLSIIAINPRKGVSAKTGRPYEMFEAQCMLTESVEDDTGAVSELIKVGRVNIDDHLKDTPTLQSSGRACDYLADFKLVVSREGELVARIAALKPLNVSRPAAPSPAPEKKAA
ncbi:hypothetical protein ACI2UC_07915 [Ralstonia nicotianae]